MQYAADLLTLIRLLLAFVVPMCIICGAWTLALVLFAIAAASDALDGWCARRWPYAASQAARLPWRRIDRHVLDNVPDALMLLLSVVALVYVISYWRLLAVCIYSVGAILFTGVRILISRGRARVAELIDIILGFWFVIGIAVVALELARRAHLLVPTLILGTLAILGLFLFKWDRVVTRPETRDAAMKRAR